MGPYPNNQRVYRQALASPQGIFCLLLLGVSLAISLVAILASIGQIGQAFPGFRLEPTLTVSAVNEAYWTGPQAGLKTYDRVVGLNGQPVETLAEFQAILRQTPIGQVIRYQIMPENQEQVKEISVAVMAFTLQDFLRSFLTLFLVGLGHILVGAVAFLLKPGNPVARVHLYMTVAIGMTTILVNDYDSTMLFPRLWLVAVVLTGGTCLHLGLFFPAKKKLVQKYPWAWLVPYGISLGLIILWQLAFQPWGYAGYQQQQRAWLFQAHFLLYYLSLSWALIGGFLGLMGMILHSWLSERAPTVRNQAKVALLGALVGYLPMTILWMILEQLLGLHLDQSGTLATVCWMLGILFPVAVAYAIVKHKMFDITFILKQSMVYTSLLALLGSGYVLVATGLQQLLTRIMNNYSELTAYMLTTALIVLVFDPLKARLRDFIDHKFFRAGYDFREALTDFVETARATINRDELVEKLVAIMNKTLHPKHIALFLRQPLSNTLKLAYAHGIEFPPDEELSLDNPLLLVALGLGRKTRAMTSQLPGLGILGEANVPVFKTRKITTQLPELNQLERMQAHLTIPLIIKVRTIENNQERMQDEMLGLLTLGEKRSELEYTTEDRQLLQSIVQQLALTLHSARLAEEVAEKVAIQQNLERARQIQKSMLPATELELAHFQVAGFSESADETGGDYYDWALLPDGRFGVGLGDVTGHGIDAALIVAMAKSCLFNQLDADPGVGAVMAALNKTIHDIDSRRTRTQKPRLMTFLYCLFDPAAMECRLASAGHWFPYLYRNQSETLTNFPEFKGVFPLGRRPPEKFKCQEHVVPLQKDDILLFYTDGLHEAQNHAGEEYGLERVERLLTHYRDLPAQAIKDKLRQDWEKHLSGQPMDDDMTLVVVRVS